MDHFGIPLFVQVSLAIGVAGLLWPEKLMPAFNVLMFPWPSSYRMLRLNSIGAIALALLLFVGMIARSY